MNIKKILFILLILNCEFFNLFSHDIKENSYFYLMGEIELRKNKGFSEPVLYKSLNHEGGLKIRVLEIGNRDSYDGIKGTWIYVFNTSPMWVSSGKWIEKYERFWIFLEDDMDIFDYEE